MRRDLLVVALSLMAWASSVATASVDSGRGKAKLGSGGDRDERRIERRDLDREEIRIRVRDGEFREEVRIRDRDRRVGERLRVRPAAVRRRDDAAAFRAFDGNLDGVISRGEWPGSARSFDVLDRNDDGVISRPELDARSRSGSEPAHGAQHLHRAGPQSTLDPAGPVPGR